MSHIRGVLVFMLCGFAAALPLRASCHVPAFNTFANVAGLPPTATPTALAVADFDRDGYANVAWTDTAANSVAFRSLGAVVPLPGSYTAPSGLAVADFDHDGSPDLAVASTNLVTIVLFTTGGYINRYLLTGGSSQLSGISAGDLNGDGKPDLAVADATGSIRTFTGSGTGTFAAGWSLATPGGTPYDIVIADVNHDAAPDLVVSDSTLKTVSVYLNDGTGNFTLKSTRTLTATPKRLAVADFQHAGVLGVAVATTAGVTYWRGFGLDAAYDLDSTASSVTTSGSTSIGAADFNGDGYPDLVVTNPSAGTVSVLLSNFGFAFNAPVDFPAGVNPTAVVPFLSHGGSATIDAYNDIYPEFFVSSPGNHTIIPAVNLCTPSGADANGDGQVTIGDVFYIINYLFTGGPAPVE